MRGRERSNRDSTGLHQIRFGPVGFQPVRISPRTSCAAWEPPSYWPFIAPALIVVLGVIIFPWAYTIWMSLHEWKVGSAPTFVGLAELHPPAERCPFRRIDRPYAALHRAVGGAAVDVRHLRSGGVSRQISDARPAARAVYPADDGDPGRDRAGVDHDVSPAIGILNYLLSLVGLPPQLWVFHPATVIPSLVWSRPGNGRRW